MGARRARRGTRTALFVALAAAALAPSAAQAQLPQLPPAPGLPQPPGQQPPNQPPPGPAPAPGDVVSYHGNPQRTQTAADESVFGPLVPRWTRDFEAEASQPLIAGDRIVLNVPRPGHEGYGSFVVALDLATGREIWRQFVEGVYYTAHIAIDSGMVFSANRDGVVRAFGLADGSPRWTRDLTGSASAPPVAAGGTVYVLSEGPRLNALDAGSGAVRWQRGVEADLDAMPALDAERVYVANGCSGATALRRSDGALLWERELPSCNPGGGLLLAGGRVYAGHRPGQVYDAASGERLPMLDAGTPSAAAGDRGLVLSDGGGLTSVRLSDGAGEWTFPGPFPQEPLAPVIADGTVYASTGSAVVQIDAATGAERSQRTLTPTSGSGYGGPHPGMSAGRGVLAATAGGTLHVLEPVLQPAPGGTDVAASNHFPLVGQPIDLVAGIGSELRPRPSADLVLEHDVHPYGRYSRLRTGATAGDGTVFFRNVRPSRNTRYRTRLKSGGGESPPSEVWAYPRAKSVIYALGPGRAELRIRLTATSSFRVGGRTLVVYFNKNGSKLLTRIGSARLTQTGAGRARAVARLRVPKGANSKDFWLWCVRGLRGYGYPDRLMRHCGASRIRVNQ